MTAPHSEPVETLSDSSTSHHPSSATVRIAAVVGSTRPTRICRELTEWIVPVLTEGAKARGGHVELLDIADADLPLLDEPLMASLGQYANVHTLAWAKTIESFDAFFFVFPQYNWGYPAALKNALDYLYQEWAGKPASMLTYGTRGGAKAADQLTEVLHGLHMEVLPQRVEAAVGKDAVDAAWQLRDVEATLSPYRSQIIEIGAGLTMRAHEMATSRVQ